MRRGFCAIQPFLVQGLTGEDWTAQKGSVVRGKDAAGPILVTVLGMVAERERKFIRERQQAGIEAARIKGTSLPCAMALSREHALDDAGPHTHFTRNLQHA